MEGLEPRDRLILSGLEANYLIIHKQRQKEVNMSLTKLYVTIKDCSINRLFKNKKFKILFGPAKGLIWINDHRPYLMYNLGLWEPYKQFAMKKYVSKGMVAYDVGAFHGYYTMVLSRLVGKEGFVYSFEPARENFEFLKNVINFNRLSNVELNQKAVGGKDGEIYCTFNKSNPMAECIFEQSGEYKVEITILNSFALKDLNKKPDIVKMDIEGFEFDALKAMDRVIDLYHPMFFIDVHNAKNHSRCIAFLKEHGYTVKVLHKKRFENGAFLSDVLAFHEQP